MKKACKRCKGRGEDPQARTQLTKGEDGKLTTTKMGIGCRECGGTGFKEAS